MTISSLPISEFCKTGSGTTPSRSKQDYYFGGNIPWVKSGELRESIITNTEETVTQEALAETPLKIAPKGSILVAMYGANVGRLGILGIDATTNQAVCHLVPDPEQADAKYIFHALRQKLPEFLSRSVGGAQPNISQQIIRATKVFLPPIAEQKRIAAILDKSEELRELRRQALRELDAIAQSIFIEMFGDPVKNPNQLSISPVGDVTDCIVPGRDKPKSFSGKIPWITTDDLIYLGTTNKSPKGFGLTSSEIEQVRARLIPKDSVILSCVGELGIVSIAGMDMVINQQLHSFQCGKKLNNVFLMYCLSFQKTYMSLKASSTTVLYMNKSVCNSIPIFLPPLPLQQEFAHRIESIEQLKTTHRESLAQLDALFASLQHRAFRGEL